MPHPPRRPYLPVGHPRRVLRQHFRFSLLPAGPYGVLRGDQWACRAMQARACGGRRLWGTVDRGCCRAAGCRTA
eukprot:8546809-Alexandrium_andersonii.AAC.1